MQPPAWTAPVPLGEALTQARFLLTERARIFLIGDFQLSSRELDGLRLGLGSLRDRHHLIPVRVTDQQEGALPEGGGLILRDPTSGRRRRYWRPKKARDLKKILTVQEEEVTTFFQTLGLEDWSIDVDESLADTLRSYLYRPRGRGSGQSLHQGGRGATSA
jgi:hypothetical protein